MYLQFLVLYFWVVDEPFKRALGGVGEIETFLRYLGY
jgi:hypothetical protein